MRTNILLTLCVVATAALFSACGAPAANNTKPANAAPATAATTPKPATPATPATPASSTSTASDPSGGAVQDFTVVNKTGVIIDKLFVSPSDKDDWQQDVLGKDVLADGESADIKFHPKEKIEKWDLKIEDSKGNSIEWHDLNLTEISKVTLHYKDGKGTAETE